MTGRREPLRAPEAEPDLGELFTLREAAQATGLSRDTIKRRQVAGQFPGARKDATGAWLIPEADLVAAGLSITPPEGDPQGAQPAAPAPGGALIPLSELSGLFDRLADAERRASRAEAELEWLRERQAHEAAQGAAPGTQPGRGTAPQGGAPGRRSWWRRG